MATLSDAEAIAQLHADSWRRTYRGIYTDEFLDADLVGERLGVWHKRLSQEPTNRFVCVAEDDDRLAGFVCGFADAHPSWGSLIDNLHVAIDVRRRGIASELMRRSGDWFAANASSSGAYLWVLEANAGARRFYEALGGTNAEIVFRKLESGNPGKVCRYTWPDASQLGATGR